jgi:7-keto-8-aminopelargonate synthetase-like enzyme
VDAAKLSYGETKRFAHQDVGELERILQRLPEDKGKLVVVDGLYSMEGDIAPLPDIIPLCKKYGARLMVDDAHAIGVLGCGKGTGEHFHMTRDIDLIMSTFSKSFASLGGFIAGDEQVVHYIKHNARALLFSASIPPSNAAAALASLKIMREEPERVEHLAAIADYMRKGYRQLGFNIGNSCTPIIPVIIGERMLTIYVWKRLFDEGVFTNPVLSPAVQPGRELLRTSYMATHTFEQMDRVLAVFERVGKEMGLI